MHEMRAEDIIKRKQILEGDRHNFDNQWQEGRDLFWPDTGEFTTRRHRGEKTTERIYDMTAALALEKGSAAIEAYMTPRNSRWHKIVSTNDELNKEATVKRWMEEATDLLFQWRNDPASRFYGQMHEVWKSELGFGNACLFVDEMERGGTWYSQKHIGSMWIETNHRDMVDTVYREYELTAKAAVQRWGDDAPKCAHDCMADEPFTKHDYITCVQPNPDHVPGSKRREEWAFEVYEVSVRDQKILERGYYHEMPYIWARYTVAPHEVYGRGPGTMMLPDIKTLQEMQKVFLRSGHKVADPPILTTDDGVLGRGAKQVRINPGGVNVGGIGPNGEKLIDVLQTGARLDITLEMADRIREGIREAFLIDIHDILVKPRVQMTATETMERAREKGEFLTPIIGRLQSELLGPLIHRELGIAIRQGALPPMPEVLQEAEGDYEIIYESSGTRMQKSQEALGAAQAVEIMAPWIEANPALLGLWKVPELGRHINEVVGVPSKFVKSESEFKDFEDEYRAAQQQAAQAEAAPEQARGVRDLAEARNAQGAEQGAA